MKSKRAILLLNMGGPSSPEEVKIFLKNMFNDKAIIDAPKPIRMFLGWLIPMLRRKKSIKNYEAIGGKSPIISHTQNLVKTLSINLYVDVFYINRYVAPYANEVLSYIKDYDEFILFPMYPHYSKTTTKSSVDDIYINAKKLGIDESKIKIIDSYYDNDIYNNIILQRIKEVLNGENPEKYELVFSAHGLPQKVIDKGDLYQKHIVLNVKIIKSLLVQHKIFFHDIHLAYQSRVGPMKWIEPYLEDTLQSLKKKKVIIVPISFTLDNMETKYELDIEYKEIALSMGIEEYKVAKVANDLMSQCISQLVKKYI